MLLPCGGNLDNRNPHHKGMNPLSPSIHFPTKGDSRVANVRSVDGRYFYLDFIGTPMLPW